MVIFSFAAFACSPSSGKDLPDPAQDLEAPATTAEDQPTDTDAAPTRTAVLAGGCFWCVEAVFEPIRGVKDVVSGYAGGDEATANYQQVAAGQTKHAEAIQITYDPTQISYGQLLKIFFTTHDPTQLNRQGPDVGTQYRSAVFYADEQEKQVAQAYIQQLNDARVFDDPIVTTLEPLTAFYPAEGYHQDYVENNPANPYVRFNALPKVEKVKQKFGDKLKDNAQ